jgi:hypothetical protein
MVGKEWRNCEGTILGGNVKKKKKKKIFFFNNYFGVKVIPAA